MVRFSKQYTWKDKLKLTLGVTIALWALHGAPKGLLEEQITDSIVPKVDIQRVQTTPRYALDYKIINDNYRGE